MSVWNGGADELAVAAPIAEIEEPMSPRRICTQPGSPAQA
jgi:hypothetical protein